MKFTAGIYGMEFLIQSAKYSPLFLQAKILEFIDTFYYEMTQEAFEKYKSGELDRLKSGFTGIDAEADELC